jgi:transcription initiation factor TFIIIB Brf1 subunit/transcription initiation factor TFIIB
LRQVANGIASKIAIGEKSKRYAIKVLKKAQEKEVSAGKDPMGLQQLLNTCHV